MISVHATAVMQKHIKFNPLMPGGKKNVTQT